MRYDWTKTAKRGLKAGLVAAAAVWVADPELISALLSFAPEAWRPALAIVVPVLLSAFNNARKHGGLNVVLDRMR